MHKLYQAYILIGENTFESKITEIEVSQVFECGTIKTKNPVFYDVLKFSNTFNSSGPLKTELEYSAGKSFVYYSTSYEKCMDYIARKRKGSVRETREIILERNEFIEGKARHYFERRVNNERIGSYPVWVEAYCNIRDQNIGFLFAILDGNILKILESAL